MPFLFCLPGPAAQRRRTAAPSAARKTRTARRDPSPRLPRRREKVWPATRRAMPQATAGRQSARRMAATPRPAPPHNTSVGRAPRPIAPAPPQKIRPAAPKFGSTARPRHAAGRPRAAKARAVWQPHRARPRRKILLLAARRDPSPRLPRRREKSGQTPDRMHPVPKHAPPAHTGGGAFPFVRFVPSSENGRSAQSQRQAPHDRQNNSARPSARHIAAQSPVSHTPRHAAPPAAPQKTLGPAAMPCAPSRPAAKIVLLVARRTPRTISPSAAPPRKVRPNTRPDAPRPKTRAPARTGEGRVSRLSVSFLPLKMAAAHNRKGKRRTIAGAAARPHVKRRAGARTTAHDRMNRGSWQAARKRMNRGM